jgi:hypothetical protein
MAVTGDEIRLMEFPREFIGYDVSQVRTWLSAYADLLDAGIAPAAVLTREAFGRDIRRGYASEAVDRFLDMLASEGGPGYAQPVVSTDPAGAARGERGLWEDDFPGHKAGRRAAWKQYQQDCDAEWLRVSNLAGTRIRLTSGHRVGGRRNRIVGSDGQVLLTRRSDRLTIAATGQEFRLLDGRVVDAETGDPVLRMIGSHSYRYCRAWTVALFPRQRWLRFPVQGTGIGNGVLTAIDESGTELLWFFFRRKPDFGMEAVLSQDCYVTPEILCVSELATPFLVQYFVAPDSSLGGG